MSAEGNEPGIETHGAEGDDGSWLEVTPGGAVLADDRGERTVSWREAARWWLRQNTPLPLRRHLRVR